jgi:DNA repair exonuclease SbcCD nuclease subunit
MSIRKLSLSVLLAVPLAAQSFIQMSDPQFGMFTKDQSFAHETANFEFAIANANRLHPAFIVITGDLVNKGGDPAQIREYLRIAGKLDPSIRLFAVPGNHDVENEPTLETLAAYRKNVGPDYYTFRIGDIAGFVLNSNLQRGAAKVPEEAAKMEAWFTSELAKAKADGVKNLIVFQHISYFLTDPNEPDDYFNIPPDVRKRYLNLMHDAGVKYVFAGHYHRNSLGKDGDLEMVTTGPVGMPLGTAKSGMRFVTVDGTTVRHRYFELGEIPETLEIPK